MASKESQELGDLWRSIGARMAANPGIDMLTRRAMLDELQELANEPVDVTYQEILAASQRALPYRPSGLSTGDVRPDVGPEHGIPIEMANKAPIRWRTARSRDRRY